MKDCVTRCAIFKHWEYFVLPSYFSKFFKALRHSLYSKMFNALCNVHIRTEHFYSLYVKICVFTKFKQCTVEFTQRRDCNSCRLDVDCDSKVNSRCVNIEHVVKRHCLKTAFTRSCNMHCLLFWICTEFCSKGLNVNATFKAISNVCQCTQYLLLIEGWKLDRNFHSNCERSS